MLAAQDSHSIDPREFHRSRLDLAMRELQQSTRRQGWISNLRVLVFLAGAGSVFVAARGNPSWIPWLWVPPSLFIGLLILHESLRVRRLRAEARVAYHRRGLENLDEIRPTDGATGERFLEPHHPFAEDLDLFGVRSLFERLCRARTEGGRARLAEFLLRPGGLETSRERQTAVRELAERHDVREAVVVAAGQSPIQDDSSRTIAWAEAPAVRFSRFTIYTTTAIAAATVAAVIGNLAFGLDGRFAIGAFLLGRLSALALEPRIRRVGMGLEASVGRLAVISRMIEILETSRFDSEPMRRLARSLEVDGTPASRQVARLGRLIDLREARRNQMFLPVGWVLMWMPLVSMAIEARRVRLRGVIRLWFDAVAEVEALVSLAEYRFENSGDPLPELVDDGRFVEAEAMGHPLLPAATCVRNDVSLGDGDRPRLLLVSGSNMSGKSTYLRALGANMVLALAGTSVRASGFRTTRFTLGATLRIRDSIQEGRSRFYAELERLKQLVDIARRGEPLLFLLDEIFHGTNSHDRTVGARALIAGLLREGAIGVVTTHDLALAEIAEELAPAARNVHFADRMFDGRMIFDYRMRDGVVDHSNALELMKAVGLDFGSPTP
ncbi:MAG: DNA mismatch repair protein MutS [Isosphaeraceae bacterium]|nr:DNA mismatch repair protein MutS [Isosphaeraceae bacterium]